MPCQLFILVFFKLMLPKRTQFLINAPGYLYMHAQETMVIVFYHLSYFVNLQISLFQQKTPKKSERVCPASTEGTYGLPDVHTGCQLASGCYYQSI